MMELLSNIISILTVVSTTVGIVSIFISLWAIITHREKYYKEKKDMFNKRVERVEKDLEKRRPTNEEWSDKRFYIYG